ncbi:MAG: hypothetical protein ABI318_16470 [Chthoniobacteraceae bacterium]
MHFNGDGKTGSVLHDNAGQICVWYMDDAGAIAWSGCIFTGGIRDRRTR